MERKGESLSLKTKKEIILGVSYTARFMAAAERISFEQAELTILKARIKLGIDPGNGKVVGG